MNMHKGIKVHMDDEEYQKVPFLIELSVQQNLEKKNQHLKSHISNACIGNAIREKKNHKFSILSF